MCVRVCKYIARSVCVCVSLSQDDLSRSDCAHFEKTFQSLHSLLVELFVEALLEVHILKRQSYRNLTW